jgi:hypothetical protein
MSCYVSRNTILAATICAAAAFLVTLGSDVLAQQPSSKTSMLCKILPSSKGFVLVTLSNLTTSTIPKGQTLSAKKGNKTIQFRAEEPILNGGSVTNRTDDKAFQEAGDCEGWY